MKKLKRRLQVVRYYLQRVLCIMGYHDCVTDFTSNHAIEWCTYCEKIISEVISFEK